MHRSEPSLAEHGAARALRALGTRTVLSAVFFLSGAAALVFETLWFRQAGLAFGNSTWASSLVLSSFMAGLALGNGLAARHGARVRSPERLFAGCELVVGVVGIALVVLLPRLGSALAPVWRPLLDQPLLLNSLRLALSFLLLMVPATAMGLTLPVLVKALAAEGESFGRNVGTLYGWNTLGAVAGALLGEVLLIQAFGVLGTAWCAGALNLLAAAGALLVAGGTANAPREAARLAIRRPTTPRARRILAGSFLAGGTLLALEVVWFRFLQLFLPGTTLTFACMLAVVLAGIGLGGLATSRAFARRPDLARWSAGVALATGATSLLLYSAFDLAVSAPDVRVSGYGLERMGLCVLLALPVSFLSGVLFTLLGQALHEELGEETRTAGLLTLANTAGATLGPLIAAFVLIPRVGMETSLFALSAVYGVTAACLARRPAAPRALGARVAIVGSTLFVVSLVAFPFGRMQRYLGIASASYSGGGEVVVATREGVTETIQYLRKDFLGERHSTRLVTNSYSMSGTHAEARRYMKLYVVLPVALHPRLESALLISFGTGSTAQALTDTPTLESIVVVDISREILEMADVVFPEPGTNPLDDPRVRTVVDDGRFFLQTTDERFDLITSEPPPPKVAGVVNLYTEEYFRLIRDRLNEDGIATYWLPVSQMRAKEAKAILRAFLDVFGDETTLWTGTGLNWMLVGTKGRPAATDGELFRAQWSEASTAGELHELGFEQPGQLGATFLMDAEDLRAATAGVEPLTDDRPKRLSALLGSDAASYRWYRDVMDTEGARERFERSVLLRETWPAGVRAEVLSFFPAQEVVNRVTERGLYGAELDFAYLDRVVRGTDLEVPVLWALGSDATKDRILHARTPDLGDGRELFFRAAGALARRDFDGASRLLADSWRASKKPAMLPLRLYVLCLADRLGEARALLRDHPKTLGTDRRFLDWLSRAFGIAELR